MKQRIIMVLSLLVLLFPMSAYAQSYNTIKDNEINYLSLSGDIIKSFDEDDGNGVCPLGPDVTKDLYGVLMILKIVAPLLCIGLSVFEAIKAVAKGDPSTDLKVVAKKFLKRMMYALILFFIPVIVDVFFQMADVWGANGTCDLMNPENNGAEQNTNLGQTRQTTENCAGYTDKEHCDRDQKCSWDNNSNTCHVLDWR